jgi:Tfp pilus assembly protein PilW
VKLQTSRRTNTAFTYIEAMISMFIDTAKTTCSTTSQLGASADGANALSTITENMREALFATLPDDTTGAFVPPNSYTTSQFEAIAGAYTIDTCIAVTFPNASPISCVGASGNTLTPNGYNLSVTASPTPPAQTLYIYRSNGTGTPNATSGNYLWEYGVNDLGVSVNQAICKTIDPAAPDSVQFMRPVNNANAPIPYEVQARIVSAYFSPQAAYATATNESSAQYQVTSLTGKCTMMRDHENSFAHEPSTAPTTSSNSWKPYL